MEHLIFSFSLSFSREIAQVLKESRNVSIKCQLVEIVLKRSQYPKDIRVA